MRALSTLATTGPWRTGGFSLTSSYKVSHIYPPLASPRKRYGSPSRRDSLAPSNPPSPSTRDGPSAISNVHAASRMSLLSPSVPLVVSMASRVTHSEQCTPRSWSTTRGSLRATCWHVSSTRCGRSSPQSSLGVAHPTPQPHLAGLLPSRSPASLPSADDHLLLQRRAQKLSIYPFLGFQTRRTSSRMIIWAQAQPPLTKLLHDAAGLLSMEPQRPLMRAPSHLPRRRPQASTSLSLPSFPPRSRLQALSLLQRQHPLLPPSLNPFRLTTLIRPWMILRPLTPLMMNLRRLTPLMMMTLRCPLTRLLMMPPSSLDPDVCPNAHAHLPHVVCPHALLYRPPAVGAGPRLHLLCVTATMLEVVSPTRWLTRRVVFTRLAMAPQVRFPRLPHPLATLT